MRQGRLQVRGRHSTALRMLRRHLRNCAGMTLIEVLAALVLISVVLIPAISGMGSLLARKFKSEAKDQAFAFARSVIEEAKALDAASLEELAKGDPLVIRAEIDGRVHWIARAVGRAPADRGGEGARLWRVEATVYGSDPRQGGASRLCSLETYIYSP